MIPNMISIIIPVYNKENTIGRCIESVQRQEYQDVEIILVDDGSNDSSLEICRKYADKDQRIVIIEKKNGGVSSARNEGIKAATGEYIQFVDADDRISPELTKILYEQLTKYNAQLAICGFVEKCKDGSEIFRKPEKTVLTNVNKMERYVNGLFQNCFLQPCWNKLYVKKYIEKYFQREFSYGEDLLFNLEYLKKIQKIIFISEALYIYDNENSKNSLTAKYREDEISIRVHLLEATLRFCEEYLDGFQSIKEISEKMMRAVMFSFFDVYMDGRYHKSERIKEIKKWISHPIIKKAVTNCRFESMQQKICCYLIEKNWSGVLLLLFWVKKTLHLYK